jgi:hypothetical protein
LATSNRITEGLILRVADYWGGSPNRPRLTAGAVHMLFLKVNRSR